MTTMTGGEAAVAALEALGVETVFGIVSVHNVPTLDAIAASSTIDFVPCRHEQGAVHAADGYARTSGRIGVALTSTGPGAANAMGGMFEAYSASSPVLMITGQVESAEFGRGRGAIHEAEQQLTMLRAVTRRAEHVSRAQDIATTVLSVASDMTAGRPRPGAVEIPIDLQYAQVSVGELVAAQPRQVAPPGPGLDAAIEILTAAARPLVIAGGGVISAGAAGELTSVAERLGAPVVTTIEGRGSIPEDHELALGPNLDLSAMDPVVADADVVLAVGTRFQQSSNIAKWLTIPGRLIHLDADVGVIGRVHPAEVALVGDARLGLQDLEAGLGSVAVDTGWAPSCRQVRDEVIATSREALGSDLAAILDALIALLPDDAVIANDATIAAYLMGNRLLPVRRPRSALRPASQAIGPGVPLAVGAAVATSRTTVVIQGDGGLMLSLGELATAVQQNLPLVVCVFNDRGYGMLRFIQDMAVGGRHTGVDLATPDLVALAAAFGLGGAAVRSPAEFEVALATALSSGGPWLIDVDLTALEPMRISPQPRPVRD